MGERHIRPLFVGAVVILGLALSPPIGAAQDTPQLTTEEQEEFLKTARVIESRPIGSGITRPWRLTLTDGTVPHDAALNVANVRSNVENFLDGTFEVNFIDAYRYNIAAFRLAEHLGFKNFIPVTVERRWNGKSGALSWWINDAMTEGERMEQKLVSPDPQAWNREIYRVRLFNNLVYDTDRNLGNMLVTADWHAWLIDFTRAFRKWKKLPAQSDLTMVDGSVLEQLRLLTADPLAEQTAPHLLDDEMKALMDRRDLIVSHFEQLTAERGRGAVVY